MMRKILRLIRGYEYQLYRFESDLLDAVKSHLAQDAALLFAAQIRAFNRIYRFSGGKEINLHGLRGRNYDDIRFANKQEQLLLATAILNSPKNNHSMKAELWLVNGRVFSVNFIKPPEAVFGKEGIDQAKATVTDVKILADPMVEEESNIIRPHTIPELPPEWKGSLDKYQPTGFRMPLAKSKRNQVLKTIEAKLPEDYLKMIEQSDGVSFSNCRVYGLFDIRKVILPAKDYYILAEHEGPRLLAVKSGSKEREIFIIDLENDEEILAGKTFVEALSNLLQDVNI